ncbi:ATP-binding cassette domain-containing protein [Anaerosporobacter sp.]|uniref:ATP-binding cassette domain-containing protein n=1 Tax=Anaerosporobacter sp. TaxID=1872529 RepID=UPI00286EC3A1|nr:ATP-binding cassette domain-containing protein [Anaerosporobacter sp.]
MNYIIETNKLCKRYKEKMAVNQMSIHIKKGDIYGLIGKNGAGKTSLMKLLLGLTSPDSGEIYLLGNNNLNEVRRKVGSLIEAPALYKNETAFENMKRFSLISGQSSDKEIRHILQLVGLENTEKKKAGSFSLGMKQRLGIAIALLGNPEILILDEPINGLDPAGIKEIRDIIVNLNKQGVTFLISSHLLDELGKIATNYGIVNDGVLVEEITAKELQEKCRTSLIIVTNDGRKAETVLRKAVPALQMESTDRIVSISSKIDDSSELNRILVEAGVQVYELRNESIGFEDFFIERIGK